MKQIAKINTFIEAEMMKGLLEKNGIESVIEGSREYASHVLGSAEGMYIVYVNEESYEQASKVISELKIYLVEQDGESVAASANDSFKKAIFCALIGTMFPILFHYFAFQHFGKYWSVEKRIRSKFLASLLFLIVSCCGLVAVLLIVSTVWRQLS